MTTAIPEYDALYSISDLHLGGPPGRQIFAQRERLGRFLRWLAGPLSNARRCGLVLAGDVIDSLPSLSGASGYVMVDEAADLVTSTLFEFHEVLDGLRAFVGAPGRELVVMIGNHDLELALPEAQQAFCDVVADGNLERRARIRFVCDGTGFRCRVGDKLVYVTHGNEADRWNHVDHGALRKAAHRRALGHAFDRASWSPNAGTMLVVDAMNRIKNKYPFVDLLKPETGAALRILALLDRERVRDVFAALPAVGRRAWAQTGPMTVLGAGAATEPSSVAEARELLGASLARLAPAETAPHSDALVREVRQLQREGTKPEMLVDDGTDTLNVVQRVIDLFTDGLTPETMRKALLDWTKDDRSFDLRDIDPVCRGVLSQLGAGIDVVITGHTHLPRWIHPSGRAGLVYLNAGTWARSIGFDSQLLSSNEEVDKQAFAGAYRVLVGPDLAPIDAHRLYAGTHRERGLVLDATLTAFVKSTGDEPRAGLARIVQAAGGVDVATISPDANPLQWR